MEHEHVEHNKESGTHHPHHKPENNNQSQIAGAIVIAGLIVAGAILLKGSGSPTTPTEQPIAKIIGLNLKSFNSCMESGKFKAKVQADIDDGVKAGVRGTPSSFILKDGVAVEAIPGALPIGDVTQMIKDVRGGNKKPLEITLRSVSPDDHILGNPNAKIVIVEYSDLDCPFCKSFHNTMHQIIKEDGDVAWIYRHYPIPQLHPNAPKKAEETECAFDQKGNEGFWAYADKVFELAK